MADLGSFIETSAWGNDREFQRKVRIMISLYAYAYEFEADPLVDDATFDEYAKLVDPKIKTVEDYYDRDRTHRAEKLDKFFKKEFKSYTGSWIHIHPDLENVKRLYKVITNG